MRKNQNLIIAILFVMLVNFVQAQRVITSFDNGWKFIKEDVVDASKPEFDDAMWRILNVPHDWSIEYPFNRANSSGRGGGYVETGIGWYRKSFNLDAAESGKKYFIEFDGVMMNSDVWINGHHLEKRPYGYISFQYELTPYLKYGNGQENVIAVRADNSLQPASRWYTGSGIYRHVRLISTGPIHIDQWGVFVSTPLANREKAMVRAQIAIKKPSVNLQVLVETTILDPENNPVKTIQTKQKLVSGADITVQHELIIDQPKLWSLQKTNLYKALVKIKDGKKTLDEYITKFGIRSIEFSSETGFSLNGENIKIKGVCLHHDGGAFGAAVPLGVWKRRFTLLKEIGVNGIRTSHNPVSPEFLDLCDQMGFLVMNETFDTWNARKSSADYGYNMYFNKWWEADTRDQVIRDRNHPSVVIYSVGNEIHDNLNDSTGFRKYLMQQNLIHSLDNTRPVTMALFRPALSHVYENGLADKMDVVGQNYRENELIAAHEKNPQRKVIGTENRLELPAWLALRDKPYMSGQFLWTGIDYIGEADWPNIVHGSGLLDRTGFRKHIGYQYQSWWSNEPMVFMMRKQGNAGAGEWVSDWSPTDIDTYDEARVQVFSNCDEVELFLNKTSLGVKTRPADNASPRNWSFTFHAGTLEAVAKNAGKEVAREVLNTAGTPAKIILSADKNSVQHNWDDVVYITATVVDENNNPCLNADDQIRFSVTGSGFLAATDNGDLSSAESFLSDKKFCFHGRCIAIIKANAASGKIIVNATSSKLKTASLTVEAIK